MYYVISKVAIEGKRSLLATLPSRDAARSYAKDNGGTVKAEADYAELLAGGVIDTGDTVANGDPPQADEPKEEPAPVASPSQADVATVVQHAAAVASQAAGVAAEAAALLGTPVGKGASIMAMAQQIKTQRATRTTIGKKPEAAPKRPATDEDTLAMAREHLLRIARPEAKMSKVQIVRELACWHGKALQRKDVFALIKSYPNDLGIADATISTQFQFARSGKEKQS